MKKTYKLSVFLIKESVTKFVNVLKKNYKDYNEYSIKQQVGYQGLIIVGRTRSNISGWQSLLQEGTDIKLESLENSSNRAVLFFKIKGRIFAITFGYGKHILNEELIEREFGLRTALNLMDSEKFISIDKANLSNLTILTKTQSSRKSKPETFNLDIISDLLRGVTGGIMSGSDDLGNLITGNEGVYIIPKISFVDIPERLLKLKKAYESNRYKTNFDWIDNLKEIKDPSLINTLKENLINDLKIRDTSKIHIAPPYLINWEEFEGYAFNSSRDSLKTNFDINDFYEYKGDKIDSIDWSKIQASSIYIKYGDKDERVSNTFWRFINYEAEIDNYIYVFTLGRWYQVNKGYISEILEYVKNIEESDIDYLPCPLKMNEREYNKLLTNSNNDLLLFDRNLVKSDYYNRSYIEVCDAFSISRKELIHVKPRSSSSTLSHLFAQGNVSSYALIKDHSFRKNLRTKFSQLGIDRNIIPLNRNNFNPNNYTITFALIDKKERSFIEALPFFSLINFRLTYERLRNFGYNVKIKNIIRKED